MARIAPFCRLSLIPIHPNRSKPLAMSAPIPRPQFPPKLPLKSNQLLFLQLGLVCRGESRRSLGGNDVRGREAAFGSGRGVVIRDLSLGSPFHLPLSDATPPKGAPKSVAIAA